ncbi:phage holin family protein [Paracoccus luteus]|uniref:phage holin family protein n=1 Tax=Paracoccus luteus TaxID=2508543 RepID=UPI00106FD441|nr:phage holin family protein [Paracoccus luteus]
MFDYARNMQLALGDVARRTAMQAAAGVVIAIGAGFLIAALWTFLADTLDWGPLGASLAVGLLFVIAGVVVIMMAKKVKHPIPSTDELRAEVETRVSLATDAALEKARIKATEVVDTVENKVHGLVDTVSYKASQFAGEAEAKVQGLTRNAADHAARSVGLTPEVVAQARQTVEKVKHSNAATIPPLLGAFAVGIALASRIRSWRDDDDEDDQWSYSDDHLDRDDLY